MSMQVTVRFFASLREQVGHAQLSVCADTIADLLAQLRGQLDDNAVAAITAENVRIAVNQTLVSGDASLRSGDEVAFLPPVTGG